jgi:hypothetical protein
MEGGGAKMSPVGDNKPKLNEKLGSAEHAAESNLTAGSEGAGQSNGPTKAERLGDAASKASEAASDIKDVAKAGPTGLESTGKEIKEGAQKGGAKGAAAAAGREAAGQAVAATATVLTAGALAEVYGKIAKGVSKALKKENFSKILILVVGIGILPMSVIFLLIALLVYAAANPFKFLQQVLTDPKARDFAFQAAAAAGKTFLSSEEVLKKYGYVENKPGVAIAATPSVAPKPGSLEYKISKINLKNAQYQTNNAPDCPYRYTTKEMIGPDGNKTYVVDKVYDKQGSEIAKEGVLVNYCIVQSMPLYNLMVRTQQARDVNKFSNTILNYADTDNSPNLKDKTTQQVKEYVHNKTYNRITSSTSSAPTLGTFGDYNLQEKVDVIRQQLALYEGDPDSVNFEFVGNPNDDKNIATTLCAFSWGYLTDENLKKSLLSRLNSGQRSGVKSNTLASTRQAGKVSNEELNPTYNQVENWQASTAYYQNLYGGMGGQLINPENLGNTAYGSNFVEAMSLLYDIRSSCSPNQPITKTNRDVIIADYNGLRELIKEESYGKFGSIEDFGLEQLMIGILRTSAGASVSGLEAGPQNYNNQSQGFRALSNQYMARMGGRFMNSKETAQQSLAVENTRREVENKNGLAYRLFGKDNIRSLANVMQHGFPKTNNEVRYQTREMIAQLSNPIKMLADIHSNFSYVALGKINKAFAADAIGDKYMRLDTVGIPVEELQSVDMVANSNEIQKIQESGNPKEKTLLAYFDKCSKSNIPSKAVFSRLYNPTITTAGKLDISRLASSEEVAIIEDLGKNLIKLGDLPSFPAINGNNWGLLGFNDASEFIACEIYMMPPSNHEIQRDYVKTGIMSKLFGLSAERVRELASKYHLYLYANSLVDLMVELSNNDQNNSIYANSSTPGPSPVAAAGGSIVGDPYTDSSSVACAEGTRDLGVFDAYSDGKPIKARLCALVGILSSSGEESTPGSKYYIEGSDGSAIVNSRVSGAWASLINTAKAAGVGFRANSTFRTMEHQKALCLDNADCRSGNSTGVARPGYSSHQAGVAIDFALSGGTDAKSGLTCNNRDTRPDTEYQWLRNNASKFGFKQYVNEAWHFDALDSPSRCT